MKQLRKWAVGQEVYLLSGPYIQKGKVVEVTWSGIVVEIVEGPVVGETYHFSKSGKGLDHDTYECGPWELYDTPEVSRTGTLGNRKDGRFIG